MRKNERKFKNKTRKRKNETRTLQKKGKEGTCKRTRTEEHSSQILHMKKRRRETIRKERNEEVV